MRLLKAAAVAAGVALLSAGLLSAAPASASTGWTIQKIPRPGFGMFLPSVSCVTGGTCTAVGLYKIKSAGVVEVEPFAARRVSGGAWTEQAVPLPAGSTGGGVGAVSCTTASFCMAVGGADHGPRAWTWDGTNWSLVPVPAPGSDPGLDWVSCWSATACMAVGQYSPTPGGPSTDLVETWDGTSWAVQPAGTGTTGELSEVSCSSASFCMAIGLGTSLGWISESWNGSTWTVHAVPVPPGATRGIALFGVSCASATACTTVGNAGVNAPIPTSSVLAERWNGTAWKVQSIPAPSGDSLLNGVSCATTTSWTAVGYNNSPAPVAESWNSASGWTLQTAATPGRATFSHLSGVSCLSATTCTATGFYNIVQGGTSGIPLAEHEQGRR